jgi:hypothetical protein
MTAKPRLPQFALTLDADLREKLEAHRVRLGVRSQAEALRVLIRGERVSMIPEGFETVPGDAEMVAETPGSFIRIRPIKAFKPHPKPGKR